MSQPPSEMAERQIAAPEKGPEVEGTATSQNPGDGEREPSLGSGCNNSSGAKGENLLLASKPNDRSWRIRKLD